MRYMKCGCMVLNVITCLNGTLVENYYVVFLSCQVVTEGTMCHFPPFGMTWDTCTKHNQEHKIWHPCTKTNVRDNLANYSTNAHDHMPSPDYNHVWTANNLVLLRIIKLFQNMLELNSLIWYNIYTSWCHMVHNSIDLLLINLMHAFVAHTHIICSWHQSLVTLKQVQCKDRILLWKNTWFSYHKPNLKSDNIDLEDPCSIFHKNQKHVTISCN